MFVHLLVLVIIYAGMAALLIALFSFFVKPFNFPGSSRFMVVGCILGFLTAFLYVHPFLTDHGLPAVLDPGARFLGPFFTVTPLKVLASLFGWPRSALTLLVSSSVALCFLAVLLGYSKVAGSSVGYSMKTGLIGGATSVVFGVAAGYAFDVTHSPIMMPAAALASFAGYALTAYFIFPTRARKAWYLAVLRKYAVFTGRARRKEYWMFFLVNLVISVVLGIFGIAAGLGIFGGMVGRAIDGAVTGITWFYSLAILIPGIAVGVRRLHDTGRSGWWILIALVPVIGAIILIIFYVENGNPGHNKYGANPKAVVPADT